jgi:hypothetical protein
MSCPTYPPNFLQSLLEFSNFIEACKTKETPKEELLKSIEMRLSNLIGKAVSAPTGQSFSVFNHDTPCPKAKNPESSQTDGLIETLMEGLS